MKTKTVPILSIYRNMRLVDFGRISAEKIIYDIGPIHPDPETSEVLLEVIQDDILEGETSGHIYNDGGSYTWDIAFDIDSD